MDTLMDDFYQMTKYASSDTGEASKGNKIIVIPRQPKLYIIPRKVYRKKYEKRYIK